MNVSEIVVMSAPVSIKPLTNMACLEMGSLILNVTCASVALAPSWDTPASCNPSFDLCRDRGAKVGVRLSCLSLLIIEGGTNPHVVALEVDRIPGTS